MVVKRLSILPLIFLLIHLSAAEEVLFRQCPPISEEHDIARNCTVHRVRISPCPEAAENKPCSILRRQQATIQFDYTPEKPNNNLTSQAYWASDMDLPFAGMETDACRFASCDGTSGQEKTYSYTLAIPNKARPRMYDVKWKLQNRELECCFLVSFLVPNRRH